MGGRTWPLAAVAAALGAPLGEEGRRALSTWLDLLAQWNARIDLTAARSDDELVDLMVADALVLSTRVPLGARVVDVGTGAGAPGLGLALLRPDLAVTLVEPLTKRVSFLRTVLGSVGRADVRIERARVADVTAGPFDVAMARATLPPPEWLEAGSKLAGPTGSVWVLLAKEGAPERRGMAPVEDVTYPWPLTGATRRAVRYSAT